MFKWKYSFIGFTLLFLAIACISAQADVLTIKGTQRVEIDKSQLPDKPDFKSAVSQRNLLGLDRSGKSLLPQHSISQGDVRTLKMCAVRVQFQYEQTDHDSTTGRGQFDMRDYLTFYTEERHGVDPAPHNREYFEKHLEALNNYYSFVSDGNLQIEGTVFPLKSDSVYTLDKSMSYYGSQEPAYGLGEFFHDALTLADQDDDIDWKTYDVFVIFHAGSDRQNDLGFPPTPHDFFTGFIILGEGVEVAHDSVLIMEGMIMPETVSQDNRANALNAVMAHEFGHQLGLVDLYDSRTFTTFVGDFSLMDNNGFGTGVDLNFDRTHAILGTIPIYPDAWSRAYLGFDEVVEIESGLNFAIKAAEQSTPGTKIYKVPISENEYYLIENRQADFDQYPGANLKADLDDSNGRIPTHVILGPAPGEGFDTTQVAPVTGEYDFLIPGSGLVIWHVDESIAWLDYDHDGINNFRDNDLQWYNFSNDTYHWDNVPFLRLMEADGIIDFGGNYYTNYGRQEDLFQSSGNNHFGPSTNPSTRANSGGYTGIDISDITGSDTLMYFDLAQELHTPGWPHHTDSAVFAPVLYDINGDGSEEIFISGRTNLLGFKADGDFIIQPQVGSEIISIRNAVPPGPLNQQYHLDTLRALTYIGSGTISTPPTVFDLDGDNIAELVFGTSQGDVIFLKVTDQDHDGFADFVNYRDLTSFPITGSIVVTEADNTSPGYEVVVGSSNGGVYILSADGATLNQTIGFNEVMQFSIASDFSYAYVLDRNGEEGDYDYFIHDLNNPAKFMLFSNEITGFSAGIIDTSGEVWLSAVSADGRLFTFASGSDRFGEYFENNPVDLNTPIVSKPVLFPSLSGTERSQLCFSGDNKLYVMNSNGTSVSEFPQKVDFHNKVEQIPAPPIMADVTADGIPEFLVGTSTGEIFMLKSDGTLLTKSPLAAPGAISTSLAFAYNTVQRSIEGYLYTVTDDGLIYSFTLPSSRIASANYYTQADGGSHHRNFQESLLSAQGQEGSLLASCYNYPNPASEQTYIRFEPSVDVNANIRIYDLSGRLVYEDDMEAVGGMANEYMWELNNYPSGVYYCRLEVNGSAGSDVKFWNIAVVK